MHRGDDHHGDHGQSFGYSFDARGFAAPFSANSDVIIISYPALARGGPGGGGGGGGGSGGTTLVWSTGYNDGVPDSEQYNIQITFKGSWDPISQIPMVQGIATEISSWITKDIQDVLFKGKIIDDLSLTIELKYIDGVGKILGQAGPTAIRTAASDDPYLPAAGMIQLDSADATNYQNMGLLDDIIEHEILHNLGFGTVWSYLGLVDNSGTDNTPTFTGKQATAAYEKIFSTIAAEYSYWGSGVPVENEGSSGTIGSHWDEQVLTNELMTGYINNDFDPLTADDNVLSAVTIASLGDLGYSVIDVLGATYVA